MDDITPGQLAEEIISIRRENLEGLIEKAEILGNEVNAKHLGDLEEAREDINGYRVDSEVEEGYSSLIALDAEETGFYLASLINQFIEKLVEINERERMREGINQLGKFCEDLTAASNKQKVSGFGILDLVNDDRLKAIDKVNNVVSRLSAALGVDPSDSRYKSTEEAKEDLEDIREQLCTDAANVVRIFIEKIQGNARAIRRIQG